MVKNKNSESPAETLPEIREPVREHLVRVIEEIAGGLEGAGNIPPDLELLRRARIAQVMEKISGELKREKVTAARSLPEESRATWLRIADFLGYGGAQQAFNAFGPGLEERRLDSKERVKKTRIPAPKSDLPGWSGLQVEKILGVNRNTVRAWGVSRKIHTHPLRDREGNIVMKPKGDPKGKEVVRYYLNGMNRSEAAKALSVSEDEVDAMAADGSLPSAPALGKGGKVVTGEGGQPLRWYWPEHMN